MKTYRYEDGLETARLLTRKLKTEDYKTWSAFFDDPEAVEFFPFLEPVSSEERANWWIERQLARYREQRYGLQALITQDIDVNNVRSQRVAEKNGMTRGKQLL